MRVTAEFVLKFLGNGYTAEDIIQKYPELEKEDVYQAARNGPWMRPFLSLPQ
jgi:uncharacterized protein (DUF433 family)